MLLYYGIVISSGVHRRSQTLCAMLMAAMLGDPLGAPKGTTSASSLPFLLEDFLANAHMPFQSWLPGRMTISNSVHHVPVQPVSLRNIYETNCRFVHVFMCAFLVPYKCRSLSLLSVISDRWKSIRFITSVLLEIGVFQYNIYIYIDTLHKAYV